MTTTNNPLHEIAEFLGGFTLDPLGFVKSVFAWNEGELKGYTGPDEWQEKYLDDLGKKLRANVGKENQIVLNAISSGHGIGKSSLVAWLILWAMSTMPDTRGVVTANTDTQLRTKTWPELAKWYNMFLGKPLFKFTATSLYSADDDREKTWRMDAVPWSTNNTEAFAGLHNQGKRLLLIFDEASSIDDKIWEVAEGALTDKHTQIIWSVFGNPTKPTGKFFECFTKHKDRWNLQKIDSRTVKITNKEQLKFWQDTYGDDSDFFRVRVRGEFPRQAVNQFFASESLDTAKARKIEKRDYAHLRPVIGVDPARFGDDASVIVVRQGDYVHTPYRYTKLDLMELAARVVDIFRQYGSQGCICVDGVGIGAGLVDFLRHRSMPVVEVQSSAKAIDYKTYSNKRSELYGKLRDWINRGGGLPNDIEVTEQLSNLSYGFNNKLQLQLESKDDIRKRIGRSPDVADALAYTFGYEEHVMIGSMTKARQVRRVKW